MGEIGESAPPLSDGSEQSAGEEVAWPAWNPGGGLGGLGASDVTFIREDRLQEGEMDRAGPMDALLAGLRLNGSMEEKESGLVGRWYHRILTVVCLIPYFFVYCVENLNDYLGRFAFHFPFLHILVGVIVCVLFIGLGFPLIEEESGVEKLWIPQDSESVVDRDFVQAHFGKFGRSVQVIALPKITSNNTQGNILTKDCLQDMLDIHFQIVALRSRLGDNPNDNFALLCKRAVGAGGAPLGSGVPGCLVDNPGALWNYSSVDLAADADFLGTISNGPQVGVPISKLFGKLRYENGTSRVKFASAAKLTYTLIGEDDLEVRIEEWEARFLEIARDRRFPHVEYLRSAGRSTSDVIGDVISDDLNLLFVGIALMFIYIGLFLGGIRSAPAGWLGLASVLLGVYASQGLAALLTIKSVPPVRSLVFLMLGIGVDDIFVIVAGWKFSAVRSSRSRRAGDMLRVASTAILATSATNFCAFVSSSSSALFSIRSFSLHAALAVLLVWFVANTIFVGVHMIDLRLRRWWPSCCSFRLRPPPEYANERIAAARRRSRRAKRKTERSLNAGGDTDVELGATVVEDAKNAEEGEGNKVPPVEEHGGLGGDSARLVGWPATSGAEAERDAAGVVQSSEPEKQREEQQYLKLEGGCRVEQGSGAALHSVGGTETALRRRRRLTPEDQLAEEKRVSDELAAAWAQQQSADGLFCRVLASYGGILLHNWVRPVVVLVFLGLMCYGIYNVTQLEQGLDRLELIPTGNYLEEFYLADNRNFGDGGPPLSLYSRALDVSTLGAAMRSLELFSRLENRMVGTRWAMGPVRSWVTAFAPSFNACLSQQPPPLSNSTTAFWECLSGWLSKPENIFWTKDFAFDGAFVPFSPVFPTGVRSTRSSMFATGGGSPSAEFQADQMVELRKLADDSGLDAFPFMFSFIFTEQWLVLPREAVQNILVVIATVFVVSLVLLVHPGLAFLLILTVGLIDLSLISGMVLWGLKINSISLMLLVMAVGLAVDYNVHIAHHFMHHAKGNRRARALRALVVMGRPVLSGAITTFLGIVTLAFSRTVIFNVFFQMFFLVILVSVVHALVFLPVLLSFVGPTYRVKDHFHFKQTAFGQWMLPHRRRGISSKRAGKVKLEEAGFLGPPEASSSAASRSAATSSSTSVHDTSELEGSETSGAEASSSSCSSRGRSRSSSLSSGSLDS